MCETEWGEKFVFFSSSRKKEGNVFLLKMLQVENQIKHPENIFHGNVLFLWVKPRNKTEN